MNMNITNRKIDPSVRNAIYKSSNDACRVILYASQYGKCLPELKTIGAKITTELPLINGCVVEIPLNLVSKLAGCKYVRYVAADMDIKAQINGK